MRSDVQLVPGPPACAFNPEKPISPGAVAQLGERELCKLEVVGSIPIGSTRLRLLRGLGLGKPAKNDNASIRDGNISFEYACRANARACSIVLTL